jgi:shikimate kinase
MNLYLIGYRGSGKSTVAVLLGRKLNRVVIDTDAEIERHAEQSISEIFKSEGEAGFRARETKVICSHPAESKLVVSLGGGAPLAKANQDWLANSGRTAWLAAEPKVLWQRISGDQTSTDRRPALTELQGRQEVEQVLTERTPVYSACADYKIEVDELSPEQIADAIANWWKSVDKK